MEFANPIEMFDYEDDEEIIQLIQAMIDKENQTNGGKINPSKTAKEPPIIFDLCGAKYEIEE